MPPRRPVTPAPASTGRGGRRWAIAGGVVAVLAASGVFAVTQFLGDDGGSTTADRAAEPTASTTQEPASGGGGAESRADTTVAVLNGTTINGLAASTADRLEASGYARGSTGDFTDQQRSASTIFYRREARRQARAIGRELDIADLRVMDPETQALAGDRADVAVVVGSDKAP